MAQTSWTDPRGQQHQYTTPGGGLRGGTRNALERQRTWRAIDPSFDTSKYQVGPTGKISDVTSTGDLIKMGALTLAAPLATAYLPGLGGAGAPPGSTLPGADDAPSLESILGARPGGNGIAGELRDLFTNPSNMVDLVGIITALAAASRGSNGQQSAESQRMQQMTEARMRRVDPLHQAVTQLAWGRLPTNARSGIAPPTNSPLP